jgi:hypothetical protein
VTWEEGKRKAVRSKESREERKVSREERQGRVKKRSRKRVEIV